MPKDADHKEDLSPKGGKVKFSRGFKRGWNSFVEFLRRYYRYIGAGLLLVVLIFILAQCAGPGESAQEEGTEEETEVITADNFVPDSEFAVDAIPELNLLIEEYFMAYATDDLETLESIANPISNNEKSYIGVFSDYIEEYQNIKCYTKSGLTDGSYLVSVYYELKFYNVDTAAPGLEFFYVETDAEGIMYINNLYSSYNFSRTENELDPNINAIIIKYEQTDDMAALLDEVEDAYTEAVSSDLDLAEMITTTIPSAMAEWLETIADNADSEDEEATESATEDEATESVSEAEATEAVSEAEATEAVSEEATEEVTEEPTEETSEETKTTVRATTNVYIRSTPSTDSKALSKALKGEEYTKVGEEGDWTIIEYNDGTAYIKSEYLEEVTE